VSGVDQDDEILGALDFDAELRVRDRFKELIELYGNIRRSRKHSKTADFTLGEIQGIMFAATAYGRTDKLQEVLEEIAEDNDTDGVTKFFRDKVFKPENAARKSMRRAKSFGKTKGIRRPKT